MKLQSPEYAPLNRHAADAPATTPTTALAESVADSVSDCRRCHKMLPIDDDGFCDACRKALEAACL